MRTVAAYLTGVSITEVTAFLDSQFPEQSDPWVLFVEGDPCLYIRIETKLPIGDFVVDEEDLRLLEQSLGGKCTLIVYADVSGRHTADDQVKEFARRILSCFAGVFTDEYSRLYWTLLDIERGHKDGVHFFSHVYSAP